MRQLITIILGVILTVPGWSAFESIGGTARSKALGEAFFGEMDGVHSVGYNPATISLVKNIEFYGAWDTAYAGLNDGSGINAVNVDVVLPFWNAISLEPYVTRRAAIGISVHRNSVILRDSTGSASEIYHEGIYSFTYAKDLNDVISRGAKISAGVRFNIYDIGFGSNEDVTANPLLGGPINKLGFGLDVGITYDFSESIRLGLAYKNLISPNMSVVTGGTNTQVSELRFGGNWNIGKLLFMKGTKVGFGLVSYGRDATDNRAADTSYNLGFEFGLVSAQDFKSKPFTGELFKIRLGAQYQPKKGQPSVMNLSGGLGFMYILGKMHRFNLDYAVEYGLNSAILQHTAGLTYSILLPNSAFVYEKKAKNSDVVEKEIEAATTEEKKPEQPKPASPKGSKTK